jgi:tetratricopeptide (TPR) repeat protein
MHRRWKRNSDAAALGYLYGFADDESRHHYALAIAAYREALEQDSIDVDAETEASRWYSLGYLYQKHIGDVAEARAAYTAAANLGHANASLGLASLAPKATGLLGRFRKT